MLADAEDRHDVGMVQLRDGLRLALEPLEALGIELGMVDRLDGDVPPERLLDRLVDDPHPAPAQFAEDAKLADPLRHEPGLLRPPAHLLHHGDGAEEFPDLLRLVGEAGFVLGDRRRLAPPAPLDKLLGHAVERVAVTAVQDGARFLVDHYGRGGTDRRWPWTFGASS